MKSIKLHMRTMIAGLVLCFLSIQSLQAELRLATFDVDATPSVGSPLAYDPMKEATLPLSCRGLVMFGAGEPIVWCTVDWLGIANGTNDAFRRSLAEAVGTSMDRVVVHTLHQHDAPRCDLEAADLLRPFGIAAAHFDEPFIQDVMDRAAMAAKQAIKGAVTITQIGSGNGLVYEVASNRRMLDEQGIVHTTRYTACREDAIRNLPEGVIDPVLRMLTFEDEKGPVAAVSFYATHPQSYYRTGGANPDFPGMARNARQASTGVFHLHFNGAGGNIGAGKYNDGSHENRQVLADRVATAMQFAFDNRVRKPADSEQISWTSLGVDVPVAEHVREDELLALVKDEATPSALRCHSAEKLAFLYRRRAGIPVQASCLRIGNEHQVLFMPGELFVEYQLAAQHMKPDSNVCMAAYGDYGTFYIGTRVAFPQGGYEVSERATNVSPAVEVELLRAMRTLLSAESSQVLASDFTERDGVNPTRFAAPKSTE
ncbi:MAG: hypothetical protein KDB03_03500 [Planctomycetales bacterium]|nr:hypothetical protein [Planctomycetales bacterium]